MRRSVVHGKNKLVICTRCKRKLSEGDRYFHSSHGRNRYCSGCARIMVLNSSVSDDEADMIAKEWNWV